VGDSRSGPSGAFRTKSFLAGNLASEQAAFTEALDEARSRQARAERGAAVRIQSLWRIFAVVREKAKAAQEEGGLRRMATVKRVRRHLWDALAADPRCSTWAFSARQRKAMDAEEAALAHQAALVTAAAAGLTGKHGASPKLRKKAGGGARREQAAAATISRHVRGKLARKRVRDLRRERGLPDTPPPPLGSLSRGDSCAEGGGGSLSGSDGGSAYEDDTPRSLEAGGGAIPRRRSSIATEKRAAAAAAGLPRGSTTSAGDKDGGISRKMQARKKKELANRETDDLMSDIDKWAASEVSGKGSRPSRSEAKLEQSAEMREARRLEELSRQSEAAAAAEKKKSKKPKAPVHEVINAHSTGLLAGGGLGLVK